MTLREALEKVPDPRSRHGRRHPLGAIRALAVRAMMSGARSFTRSASGGETTGADMSRALGFSRELTPNVVTLHRMFSRLDDREQTALVRDVPFHEDRCQVRSGSAPQTLCAIRNAAIGLLRIAGIGNIAAALRRNAARPNIPLALVGALPIPR